MENLKISTLPFLAKAVLFYLFIKIVDGFFGTLGTEIFQNTSPVLKSYMISSIADIREFYQWLTKTELKLTPLEIIICMLGFYFIYRISNRFI